MPDKHGLQDIPLLGAFLVLAAVVGEAVRTLNRNTKMPIWLGILTFFVNATASFTLGLFVALLLLDTGMSDNAIAGVSGFAGYLGAATTEQFMRNIIRKKLD